MDKDERIIEIKRDFISNTLSYENGVFMLVIGAVIGFLVNASASNTWEPSFFITMLIIIGVLLIILESIIETLRVKKYNELKEEVEKGLLSRPIQMSLHK